MKKAPFFKALVLICFALLVSNILSSCDSCSRDTGKTDVMENENEMLSGDTLINDHTNNSQLNTPQSSNRGSGNGRATTGSQSGQNDGTNSDSGASTGYGDSNSPIENSSTPSVKSGTPVQNSGAAGTGLGTGTGSTGNNSKVTRPEDQN